MCTCGCTSACRDYQVLNIGSVFAGHIHTIPVSIWCSYIYIYINVCINMNTYKYISISICISICMYMYMHIYIVYVWQRCERAWECVRARVYVLVSLVSRRCRDYGSNRLSLGFPCWYVWHLQPKHTSDKNTHCTRKRLGAQMHLCACLLYTHM